jgi:excisionase family DNA binding protein
MLKSKTDKYFYSREEAAEILCCSLPTIARRLRDGAIPYVKLGHRVLIPTEFLEQLAEKALSGQRA